MYCQQRLLAIFYAVLGVISNTTQENPLSSPYGATSDDHQASCSGPLLGSSECVTTAPTKDLEGLGCAISLICPGGVERTPGGSGDNGNTVGCSLTPNAVEPILKLTLAITNVGGRPIDVDHCETVVEQLALEYRENTLHRPVASVQSSVPHQLDKAVSRDYSMERRPRQDMSRNETDTSGVKKAPPSNPQTQGYHGILKYIISKMENGKGRRKRDAVSNVTPDNGARQGLVQRGLYSLGRPSCEDTICEGGNWRTLCSTDPIPDNKKDQCIMCYPQKHMALVHGYCREQKYRELDVFYKTCALLGASILAATLLYLLREIYRRLRMRYQFLKSICHRSQLSGSSTTKTGLSMHPIDALSSLVSGVPKAWKEPQRTYAGTVGEANAPTIYSTMIQQKFRRLGPFLKDHRKRVQDIFDLEDYQNEPELGTRVPVLPRARNASIRRHIVGSSSRTNSYSSEDAGSVPRWRRTP
ncbi:hypothetical protein AbraIFM66951_000440 [Aspergillus brasiliensis]|uniref:Uncharacterized protein n=1 Tax=Aspergillus brasiliensis TaxID=319629 RepID=A0A9W5YLS6_9EURO|nr:hypothetical protein AbraCBS73388_000427 [Aspergillus brasiliensis]GKZ42118.1 hypothetical protein AbraIFM66951_000440 [Aspergillus brasiliensis]